MTVYFLKYLPNLVSHRNSYVLLLVFATLFSLQGCQQSTVDWDTLDNSVIRLAVRKGQNIGTGSAFAINDQGYYVTNHHVIELALSGGQLVGVESMSPAIKSHPATVIWNSQEKDLAIVYVPDWRRPPMRLGDASKVKKNQTVMTIGFPGASDFSPNNPSFTEPKIKRGVISVKQSFSLIPGAAQVKFFEHDATINSGNSGGPLVDQCGRVIGINDLKRLSSIGVKEIIDNLDTGKIPLNVDEGTFFSISVEELINILKSEKISFLSDSSFCRPLSNNLNSVYFLAALLFVGLSMSYIYLRFRYNPVKNVQPDSRYLSKWLHEKLNKNSSQIQENNMGAKLVRGPDGQIIKVNEKNEPEVSDNSSIKLRLQPVQSNWPEITLALGDSCTLGRDPNQVDVTLDHPDISRKHARVRANEKGELQVIDLGSSNGTFVDHAKVSIEDWHTIKVGQRLILSGEEVIYQLKSMNR